MGIWSTAIHARSVHLGATNEVTSHGRRLPLHRANVSTRREFAWGRWIRVSIAHHYLAVDRRWFDQHIRPSLTLIKISKQARAFIRAEIDEAAQRVEDSLRDGRPSSEKGVTAWVERERAASLQMPKVTKSSANRCKAKPSTLVLAQLAKSKRNSGLPPELRGLSLKGKAERVLASLSEKLRPGT